MTRHKTEKHEERRFSCSYCSLKFKRKEHLQHHTEKLHKDGNKEKPSNESTESCLDDSDHQSEIPAKRLKIEDEKNVISCNLCKFKTFTSLNRLNRHKREHHEERSFVCSYCYDKFKRKEHLQKHIVSKHGNAFQLSPTSKSPIRTPLL